MVRICPNFEQQAKIYSILYTWRAPIALAVHATSLTMCTARLSFLYRPSRASPASLGLGLRTASEANREMVEGGGWSVTGDRPAHANVCAARRSFPLSIDDVPIDLAAG